MASNVYGNPITDDTLKGIPKYADKSPLERKDRADVAMLWKNAQNKDISVRSYVENLKKAYGDGISALCLIYNATGGTLQLVDKKNWYGHVGSAPYPQVIANGQWGAYLHVHPTSQAQGSSGGVVYRGKNNSDEARDWMVSWSVPYVGDNKVYCEAREAGHYTSSVWDAWFPGLLSNSDFQHKDTWGGCYSTAIIGEATSPIVEAILTLENVID